MAFGTNELFKDLITFLDPNKHAYINGIMPMRQVLLSGVLTGMVSAVALVRLFLYRLLQTTSEFCCRNK